MNSNYGFNFKQCKIFYCGWLIILLVFNNASAGTFSVMINADGGIPAVDTIVQQGNQSPPPTDYLMETLTAFPPESVRYLLVNRPTGNLLDLINQNPDWSVARLHRTITIKYPFTTDATAILQSLENDSLVESVGYRSAVLNPVVFAPEPLVTGDEMFVNIAMNSECDEIGSPGLNIQGLSHNINLVGNVIELEAIMSVSPPGQPTICLNQSNVFTQYNLGQFPAGNYQLRIFKVYGNLSFPIDSSQRIFLGEKNFQVVNANLGSAQVIPVFGFYGLLLMLLFVPLTVYLSRALSIKAH